MVFTSADPVRAPLTGSPFDQTVTRRGIALAARNEIARPVAAVAEIATSPPESDRSIDAQDLFADIRAAAAAKAMRGERPMGERPWMPPDGRMVHRHPAGAPSEAVPALAELQARSSFDPVHVHQQAATRYAFVSAMPATLAERRRRSEVLA